MRGSADLRAAMNSATMFLFSALATSGSPASTSTAETKAQTQVAIEGPENETRQGETRQNTARQPEAEADPFNIDLAIDLPIIGLTGAIYLGTDLIAGQMRWQGCHACDTSQLGPLDRRVLDNYNPAAQTTSDVFLYSTLSAPFVADFIDVMIHKRGIRSWAKDLVVLTEVATINLAITNTIKFAVLRPRPFSYGLDGSDRDPGEGDARLSFFSGHASTTFAMASAYGMLFQARHPRSKWRAPVWVLGYGLATTTGVMRVTAGKHFWSDVVVGAIAGSAIGLAIPALHLRRPSKRRFASTPSLSVAADRYGTKLALRGRF